MEEISKQLPENSRVLIVDLVDIKGNTPYLGKYISDNLQVGLVNKKMPINIVDRNKIELSLEEIKFQKSGLIDVDNVVKMGSMLGANVLIYGELSDLEDYIEINIKINDIEKSSLIGGTILKIKKDKKTVKLLRNIIKMAKKDEEEINEYTKKVAMELENYKKARLLAIEEEIKQKKFKIENLNNEIRAKSIDIKLYEEKKVELQKTNSKLKSIHYEIDRLNENIEENLKIGMTKSDILEILGNKRINEGGFGCMVAGKYFLLFEGQILTSIVTNGSNTRSCSSAKAWGINIATY
ncbi:MAG: hypothetical protein L6420_08365 [Elusimicrobia bacterium]|nr:hypothetical protein [Elusimicrobiota bacterium]